MPGRDYIQAALLLIEELLLQKTLPSVQFLAQRIGYSVHHFSRLFSTIAGVAPSVYITQRALSFAAVRIRSSNDTLRLIAVECGFENYEVFSRAFHRQFGIGPRAARLHLEFELALTFPMVLATPPNFSCLLAANPEIIIEPGHWIAGMWFYMDGSERTFHRPWGIFSRHAVNLVGACEPRQWFQYAVWNGHSGKDMNILCALETSELAQEIQSNFFSVRYIPPMRYLRFIHTANLADLAATYSYIYGDYLAKTDIALTVGWEFQRFSDAGSPLEICIPIGLP